MRTGRLEAFSDGVLAIVLTIMVLELKVPANAERLVDLWPLWPVFLSYVLSFVYLGIYWYSAPKNSDSSLRWILGLKMGNIVHGNSTKVSHG